MGSIAFTYLLVFGMLGSLIYAVHSLSINYQQLGVIKYFLALLALSACQIIFNEFTLAYIPDEKKVVQDFYILSEFFVLLIYFKHILNNIVIKKIINFLMISTSLFIALEIARNGKSFSLSSSLFSSYETILFLILSLLFFIQLLEKPHLEPIPKSANFILVSGIFFFFGITSPIFFLSEYLPNKTSDVRKIEMIITRLAYISLYITIAKSSKCLKYSKV